MPHADRKRSLLISLSMRNCALCPGLSSNVSLRLSILAHYLLTRSCRLSPSFCRASNLSVCVYAHATHTYTRCIYIYIYIFYGMLHGAHRHAYKSIYFREQRKPTVAPRCCIGARAYGALNAPLARSLALTTLPYPRFSRFAVRAPRCSIIHGIPGRVTSTSGSRYRA